MARADAIVLLVDHRAFGSLTLADLAGKALIDTRGCPQGVISGHLDEVRFAEVVNVIDQLRLRSLPDRTAAIPAAMTTVR